MWDDGLMVCVKIFLHSQVYERGYLFFPRSVCQLVCLLVSCFWFSRQSEPFAGIPWKERRNASRVTVPSTLRVAPYMGLPFSVTKICRSE